MLDEAHAFGVFGQNLAGIADELDLLNEVDLITITLGKALGSVGAICVGNNDIIDYLINKASSFIFSTALAPVNVFWSKFLLEEKFNFLKYQQGKLKTLFSFVHNLYPTISSSQIIPVVLGEENKTGNIAKIMQKDGYFVLPINPPTVPVGTSRLRVSLCADIEEKEILAFFDKIKAEKCRVAG